MNETNFETTCAVTETKKSHKKRWILLIGICLLIIAAVLSWFLYFSDLFAYSKAMNRIEAGKFQEAYDILTELGDFKDSKKQLERFEWVVSKETKTSENGWTLIICNEYNKDGLLAKELVNINGDEWTYEYEYTQKNDKLMVKYSRVNEGKRTILNEYEYGKSPFIEDLPTEGQEVVDVSCEYDDQLRLLEKIEKRRNGEVYTYKYEYVIVVNKYKK